MIKVKVNNEYKDVVKIFCGGTLQKEIIKVWSREAQEYVYESSVEYTGSLPITINANGDALIDYRIFGADGGVGVATENLFDKNANDVNKGYVEYGYLTADGTVNTGIGSSSFSISEYISLTLESKTIFLENVGTISSPGIAICFYDDSQVYISGRAYGAIASLSVQKPSNATLCRVTFFKTRASIAYVGSTAPTSYIPYGYKLPMTIGDGNTAQTVPVYIGENQLDAIGEYRDYVDFGIQKIVRKIGIHTVTGAENWNRYGIAKPQYVTAYINLPMLNKNIRCNSLPVVVSGWNKNQDAVSIWVNGNIFLTLTNTTLGVSDEESIDVRFAAFKSYLASLYNSGNPVKIWYVSSSQTEQDPPVPLPEIPTIKGETIIDYDGTPKPSQLYIKYRR